ncbi:hypothetical protein [Alteromonas mediterranea]|uniref:hypothetical protein n=1 Tax=Alteromonas mediterranea TaxID=314275 RepID=UPI002FE2C494|tara:strand:- start:25 stop:225 length:201 start_codon:yes stop_codon:yes gene_type:complete
MEQIKELIVDIKHYISDNLPTYVLVLVLLIGLFFLLNHYENAQRQQLVEAQQTIERIKLKLSMLGD